MCNSELTSFTAALLRYIMTPQSDTEMDFKQHKTRAKCLTRPSSQYFEMGHGQNNLSVDYYINVNSSNC